MLGVERLVTDLDDDVAVLDAGPVGRRAGDHAVGRLAAGIGTTDEGALLHGQLLLLGELAADASRS